MSNPLRVAKGLRIIIAALILFILFASSVVNAQSKSLNYIGDFNGNVEPITAVDLGTDVSEVLVSPTQFSIAGESGVSRFISDLQSGPTGAFRSVVPVGSFIFGIQDRAMVSFSITNDVTPITQVGQGIVRIRCIAESTPSCLVQNGNGGIYARGSQMGGGFCGAASNTMIPGSDSRNIHMYQMGIGGSVFVEGSRILVCSNEFNPGPSNLIFGEHSLDSGFNVNQIAVGSNFFFTLHSNTSLVLFGKCVDDNCSDVGDMPGRFLSKANFGSDNAISIASDGVVGYILLSNGAILGFGDSTSHPFITTTTLTIVPDTVSELTFAPSDHLIAATNIIAGIEIDGTGCSAGQRYVGGVCTPCEEGYFCPTPYTYEFCPNGEWSVAGASSIDQCTPCAGDSLCQYGMKLTCAAGQYADFMTNTCGSCPSTHYSAANARECTLIPAGHYGNGLGPSDTHTDTIECPAGSFCTGGAKALCTGGLYTDFTGAPACITCGVVIAGFYATGDPLVGNTQCIACEAGNMCSGGVKTACTGSAYQSTGSQTSCDTCSYGSYTTGPEGGRTGCVTCAAGHSCDGATSTSCSDASYQPDSGESSCLPCASGRYTNNGFLGPNTQCTDCTAGHFCNGTTQVVCAGDQYAATASLGSCSTCAKGSYTNLGAAGPNTACTLCSEGHACNGIVSTSCAGNQFANETGLEECFTCGSGNYTNNGAAGPNDSCDFCPIGHSCNGVTRARCQYGNFADEIGLDACKVCGAGNFTDNGAPGPNQACEFCPLGFACGNGIVPTACVNDKFADETGLDACNTCQSGSYTNNGYSGNPNSACTTCDAGYFCDGTLSLPCNGNQYSSTGGQSSCETCASGSYLHTPFNLGYTACSPCLIGAECDGTANLVNCLYNTYSPDIGASSCQTCPQGSYTLISGGLNGNTDCVICPIGAFCDGDTRFTCVGANYTTTTGSTESINCPPGSFTGKSDESHIGNSECNICRVGHECIGDGSINTCVGPNYVLTAGNAACEVCAAGFYTNVTVPNEGDGNTVCEPCVAGSACPGDGSNNLCLSNTFSNAHRSPSCANCLGGSYIIEAIPGQGNTDCKVCPSGYICDSITITPCTDVSYTNTSRSESCLNCGSGRYTISTDGVGNNICALCPLGKKCSGSASLCTVREYSDVIGASTCKTCGNGKYTIEETTGEGNAYCIDCPLGSQCDGLRTKCEDDKYADVTGLTTCKVCPAGYYTSESILGEGNTECTACPIGYSCNGNIATPCSGDKFTAVTGKATCDTCVSGRFTRSSLPEGNNICDVCPAGSACLNGIATQCVDRTYTPVTGRSECASCATGSYTSKSSSTIGNNLCLPCPAGHGCDALDGSAVKCTGDLYSFEGVCTVCPSGRFVHENTPGLGNTHCTNCPQGYECNSGVRTKCTGNKYADGDSHGTCQVCAAGSYVVAGTDGANIACIACELGFYCDGQVRRQCANEWYTDAVSSTACSKCLVGNYLQHGANGENIGCVTCPAGKFCDGEVATKCEGNNYNDATGKHDCAVCLPGSFTTKTAEGNTACTACPAGKRCDGVDATNCVGTQFTSTTGQITCSVCPNGSSTSEASAGEGNTLCEVCTGNEYCNGNTRSVCADGGFVTANAGEGNSGCLPCPAGKSCTGGVSTACLNKQYTEVEGQSSCGICPDGKFTTGTSEGNTLCTSCPRGYACDGDVSTKCVGNLFATTTEYHTCSVCSPGSYIITDGDLNVNCEVCPVGQECNGIVRTACADNRYADVTGLQTCKTCDPGYYITTSANGNIECTICPVGESCDGINRSVCTGTGFSDVTGLSTCKTCPSGSYVDVDGGKNVDCNACQAGRFCDGQNSTACTESGYNTEGGRSECLVCPNGSFTTEAVATEGNTQCTVCLEDKYCDGDNQFTCPPGKFTSANTGEGNSICTDCPIGHFCNGQEYFLCTGSLFANTTGLADCHVCPSGFFTVKNETVQSVEGSGNLNCSSCPPGWFCENGVDRTPCDDGTFTASEGATSSAFCSSEYCPHLYSCVGGVLVFEPNKPQSVGVAIILIIVGVVVVISAIAIIVGFVIAALFLKSKVAASGDASAAAASNKI